MQAKKRKTAYIIPAIIILILLTAMGHYNSFVTQEEAVDTAWAQVENQYQRRADLIPNLVKTVKAFATQERDVFVAVTEARANATNTTVDIDDAASLDQFKAVQGDISSALARLLVTVEAYPELKSDQNFLDLQAQLEGTENRISVERKRYNERVQVFNTSIRRFPGSIAAALFSFDAKQRFQAQAGADQVPVVDFES